MKLFLFAVYFLSAPLSLSWAYMLGSLNGAIIVSKFRGDDIRRHGSRNAGATNALRTYGKGTAVAVALIDTAKGVIAVLMGYVIGQIFAHTFFFDHDPAVCVLIAGAYVILGHNYPCYYGFKGGKGVLTSLAVLVTLQPVIGLIGLTVGIVVIAITKYVSLGSIIGVVLVPLTAAVLYMGAPGMTGISGIVGLDVPFIVFSALVAVLTWYRHKDNIKRLIRGEENKIGSK